MGSCKVVPKESLREKVVKFAFHINVLPVGESFDERNTFVSKSARGIVVKRPSPNRIVGFGTRTCNGQPDTRDERHGIKKSNNQSLITYN